MQNGPEVSLRAASAALRACPPPNPFEVWSGDPETVKPALALGACGNFVAATNGRGSHSAVECYGAAMRRTWRASTAILGLWALVLQFAIPFWHMPAFGAAMLCTAQGLKPVSRDQGDQPATPVPMKACPVCQLAQAGGTALAPMSPVLTVPVAYHSVLFTRDAQVETTHRSSQLPAPRGPPRRA